MMNLFSQRNGITKPKQIQKEQIDKDLKNSLWSFISKFVISNYYVSDFGSVYYAKDFQTLCELLWFKFYKLPIDEIPKSPLDAYAHIRSFYFKYDWHQILDLVEFLINLPSFKKMPFKEKINLILEKESSAYRIAENGLIIEISNEIELNEINLAIKDDMYFEASQHILKSAEFLYNRSNPDYENSIKEAISAVESICTITTGLEKADLNTALGVLENKGIMHKGLKKAFNQLYGFTSNEGGIRHANVGINYIKLSKADAQYFLVTCSAFVNYVKSLQL